MGQILDKIANHNFLRSSRKRKRSSNANNESGDEQDQNDTQAPKKKKLLTATQYIYQALFKEQQNSDISVWALGRVWKLHKVYLCQSPYFYSMFNGSWREAHEASITLEMIDERITCDSLDAVFGSLYSDEIEIEPKAVMSILATATLFHLESIIDRCIEVMAENINVETVIDYYECACQYGCLNVKKKSFDWLLKNLLCVYSRNPKLLRQISIELMYELISSPDLYVMQTEFSLYTLLRTWIYLRLHPDYEPSSSDQQQQAQNNETDDNNANNANANNNNNNNGENTPPTDTIQSYFVNRPKHICFLVTAEGQQFIKPFQALRTQYLTNHNMDIKIIFNDNIIPQEWLHKHVLNHWSYILKVDHNPEEGPQNLDAEVFNKHCMRCGRVLLSPDFQKWRWTGFNYGLDLILIADSRSLCIRRHHRNEHERLLSLQTKRQFMIRASVTSINTQRQAVFTQKSDILSLNLEKNEESLIMYMDQRLALPLLISVNLLVAPPTNQSFKEHILVRNEDCIPISDISGNYPMRAETPTQTDDNGGVGGGGGDGNGSGNENARCVMSKTPLSCLSERMILRDNREISSNNILNYNFSVSLNSSNECQMGNAIANPIPNSSASSTAAGPSPSAASSLSSSLASFEGVL